MYTNLSQHFQLHLLNAFVFFIHFLGTLLVSYPSAHTGPIKSVVFGMSGTHVYTGSTDGTARLHGLRSGNTLRDYTGHTGEVTCVTLSRRNEAARDNGEGEYLSEESEHRVMEAL